MDELSGFVFFNREIPIDVTRPIINEGIALEVYYNNEGRRPDINFNYSGSSNITQVSVYCLKPGDDHLSLVVDRDCNISRYNSYENNITFAVHGLFYFKVVAEGEFSLNLTAQCVEPPAPICIYPPIKYIKVMKYGCQYNIPVAKYKFLDNGTYLIVPFPGWKAIADLIKTTFIITQQPIPLTPIVPLSPDHYILNWDAREVSPFEPSFLPMLSDSALFYTSNSLWTQSNYSTIGVAEDVSPSLINTATQESGPAPTARSYKVVGIYWSITPAR